jgi:hypothetical protein
MVHPRPRCLTITSDIPMHIVAILVVLAIIGYLVLGGRRAPAKSTLCRWMPDKMQPHETMTRWVCGSCGEFGYSRELAPPEQCKRYFKRFL